MADATVAQSGAGVTLAVWGVPLTSPPVWTNLGPIRDISPVSVSRQEVDSTTLDSVRMERIGGLPDGDSVTIKFTTASTNKTTLKTLFDSCAPVSLGGSGNSLDFRKVVPGPAGFAEYFSLLLTKWHTGAVSPNGLMESEITGRITSTVTTTATH